MPLLLSNDENARFIPMVGKDLAGILERRKAARTVKRDGTALMSEYISHHNANPIVDIRKAWGFGD